MRRPAQLVLAVAIVAAAVLFWLVRLSPRVRHHRELVEILQRLRADDPETRKRAAWAALNRPEPPVVELLVTGILGKEPHANVREAYVYALGRIGDPRNFAPIESAIDTDPSGYVRAAAWLAAARIDPDHFRGLAETRGPPQHPWDKLGVAQGWLYLGDVRGLPDVLESAAGGDESRAQVASRALYKWLRPLLETVGRWPAGVRVVEGQSWGIELVRTLQQRCEHLDLQAVSDGARRHQAATYRVRRNVKRLTRARDGLASLLFAQ